MFVTPQVTTQNTLDNISKIADNRPDIEVALLAVSDIVSNASTTNMIIAEQIAEKREDWISNIGSTALRKITGSKKSLGVETSIPEIAISKIFESDQYLKKLALCLNIGTMFAETSVEETLSLFNQEIHKAKPGDINHSEDLSIEQSNTYDQTSTTNLQDYKTSKSNLRLETLHIAPHISESQSLDRYSSFQSEKYNSVKPDESFAPHTAISSQIYTSADQIQNLPQERFTKEKPFRSIENYTSVDILYNIFSGNAKVLQPFVFNNEKANCKHRKLRPMNINETISSDLFTQYTSNLPIEKINKSIPESNLPFNISETTVISEVPSYFEGQIPSLRPLIGAEANNLATVTSSTNHEMESFGNLKIEEIKSELIRPKTNPYHANAYFNNIEIILENLRSIEKFEKMKELYTSTRKHLASKIALNVFDSQNLVEDTHNMNQSKPNREKLNIVSEPFNLSTSIHKQQLLMDNVNFIEPKTGSKQRSKISSENRLFNIGSKHMQTALEHPKGVPKDSTKLITAKTSKTPMRNETCLSLLQQSLEDVKGVPSDNITLLKPNISQTPSELVISSGQKQLQLENTENLKKDEQNIIKLNPFLEDKNNLVVGQQSCNDAFENFASFQDNQKTEKSSINTETTYFSTNQESKPQMFENISQFKVKDQSYDIPDVTTVVYGLPTNSKQEVLKMDYYVNKDDTEMTTEAKTVSGKSIHHPLQVGTQESQEKIETLQKTKLNLPSLEAPILMQEPSNLNIVSNESLTNYENTTSLQTSLLQADKGKQNTETPTLLLGMKYSILPVESSIDLKVENYNHELSKISITDTKPVATNTDQNKLEQVKVVKSNEIKKCENAMVKQEKGLFIGNISDQIIVENTDNLGEKQNSTVKVTGISQESYATGTLSQQVPLNNISNINTATNNLEKSKQTYQIGNLSAGVNMQQLSLDTTKERSENSFDSYIPSVTNESRSYHLGVNTSQTKLDTTASLKSESLHKRTSEFGDVNSLIVAETNQLTTRENPENLLNFTFNKKAQASRNIKTCQNYSLDINMPLESLEHDKIAKLQKQGANINQEPETFVIGLNSQSTTEDALKNLESYDNNIYEYASVTLTAPERKKHGKIVVNQFMNKSLEEEINEDDMNVSADKSIDENITKNASISFQLQHGMDVDFTVFLGDTDETEQTGEQNAVETTFKLHPRQAEPQPVEHQPDVYSSYKQTISTNDFNLKLKKPCKPTDSIKQECTFNNNFLYINYFSSLLGFKN